MKNIAIISSSIRKNRKSHRVSVYLENYITSNNLASVTMLDLAEYNFPLFGERLQYLTDIPENVRHFAGQIVGADGIIVVTPEYNGGIPASLKNVIDLLYQEWKKMPIGIATVSSGQFGGSQVGPMLAFTFLKIGALVTPAVYRVPFVEKDYDEHGNAVDKEITDKRGKVFLDEFFWNVEAKKIMSRKNP